jgi:hypothetical protein
MLLIAFRVTCALNAKPSLMWRNVPGLTAAALRPIDPYILALANIQYFAYDKVVDRKEFLP